MLEPLKAIWLPFCEQEHAELEESARQKLLQMSAATIDKGRDNGR